MKQIKIIKNFMDKSIKDDIIKLQKQQKSNEGHFSKDNNKYKIPEKNNINFFNKPIPLSTLKKEKKFYSPLSTLPRTRNLSHRLKTYSVNNKKSNNTKQFLQNKPWNEKIKYSSLYTLLAMKKNELFDEYKGKNNFLFYTQKKQKLKTKNFPDKLRYLNTDKNIETLSNDYFEEKNKNEKEFENYLNKPQIYISNFHGDLLNSEKLRYNSIMEKLILIRNYIKEKPSKANDIIKKFLINNGLYNPNFISENKIKNFLYFIRQNFDVDPSKTFHENLLNILNGKYHKISKKMQTPKIKQTPRKIEFFTIEKQEKLKSSKKSNSINRFKKYLEHINKDLKLENEEGVKWELDLRSR